MRNQVDELFETRGSVHIGDDEWVKGKYKHGFMEFIHEVNRVCDERGIEPVFGEPKSLADWWVPGMFCEEYPKARVVYSKGKLDERSKRGEGYRIVVTEDHDTLDPIWDEAFTAVLPRLEVRDNPEPTTVTL